MSGLLSGNCVTAMKPNTGAIKTLTQIHHIYLTISLVVIINLLSYCHL